MIAHTPKPPYYSVIFTSTLNENTTGYADTADKLEEIAKDQDGFLGIESARNEIGITVSYWKDLDSIRKWKAQSEHRLAQEKGRSIWYKQFKVRIAKVERDYSLDMNVG
jgi:heme-degrading monooxygenase HmoA